MDELDLIAHADTPIGTIYLGRRRSPAVEDWVYEIQINGHLLMSSLHNASEKRLSASALELHRGAGPLRVLVGGLGLGYTAQAALAGSRVGHLCVFEKMDFVVDWMSSGLLPLSETLAADKRMEVVAGDIYDYLLGPATETYDIILVDVDHAPSDPLSEASLPFYSVEGQQRVAKHLSEGGVLGVWSAKDDDAFAHTLDEAYPRAHREGVSWQDAEEAGPLFHNVLFMAETGVA